MSGVRTHRRNHHHHHIQKGHHHHQYQRGLPATSDLVTNARTLRREANGVKRRRTRRRVRRRDRRKMRRRTRRRTRSMRRCHEERQAEGKIELEDGHYAICTRWDDGKPHLCEILDANPPDHQGRIVVQCYNRLRRGGCWYPGWRDPPGQSGDLCTTRRGEQSETTL